MWAQRGLLRTSDTIHLLPGWSGLCATCCTWAAVTELQVRDGFGSSEEELELVKAASLEKTGERMDKMLEWDLNLIPVLPEVFFGHLEINDLNILRL